MRFLRTIGSIAQADFRERTRSFGYILTLALAVYVTYLFVPPNHARYATLEMGGHRGIYNSAWIGGQVALLTTTYIMLIGFYLARGGINRDRSNHVGQLLAATRMNNSGYTLGKMLSNIYALSLIVGVIAVSSIGLQLLRAEETTIKLHLLFAPFLYLVMPTVVVVSAIVVLFECIPVLRGGAGNVIYFLGIPGLMAVEIEQEVPLLGFQRMITNMMEACQRTFPDYIVGKNISVGGHIKGIGPNAENWDLTTFVWDGMTPSGQFIGERFIAIAIAVGIALVAAVTFERFDPARSRAQNKTRKPKTAKSAKKSLAEKIRDATTLAPEPALETVNGAATTLPHLTPLGAVRIRGRFLSLLIAELKLALGAMPWWWLIGAAGFIATGLAVPAEVGRAFVWPWAWLWPILLWSQLGNREIRQNTHQIVFATARPLRLRLPAAWLACVLVGLAVSGGIGLRAVFAGDTVRIGAWVVGALFVPSLALALGAWSRSSRLFEIVYLFLWYIGPGNGVGPLDYAGVSPAAADPGRNLIYLTLAVVFFIFGVLGARRQLHS